MLVKSDSSSLSAIVTLMLADKSGTMQVVDVPLPPVKLASPILRCRGSRSLEINLAL